MFSNGETKLTLIPLNEEEIENINLAETLALYKDETMGNINVGRPSLLSYFPVLANMFGYENATDKNYYYILKEMVESDKPIYQIYVNQAKVVTNIELLNNVLDYDDVLGKENKINRSK